MMNVMRLAAHGGPGVFELARHDDAVPLAGEFLVRVLACGVCGHDVLARSGQLAAAVGSVLGHEISGRVEAVGSPELADWIGRRVALVQRRSCGECADCRRGRSNHCRDGAGFYGDDIPGGYAEFVIASPLNAVEVPDTIDDATAAILSCAVGTGIRALRQADVVESDVVVITGAGGGVGIHSVQLAHHLGLRVIAMTSSVGKVDAILEAGADSVLVAPTARQIRAVTEQFGRPRGADACIETTGSPTFALSLRCLAPGGRLVLVGNTSPGSIALEPGLTIVRELRIIGSAHATREDLVEAVELVASAKIRPRVARSFSLGDAVAAHTLHDSNSQVGRIVLIP